MCKTLSEFGLDGNWRPRGYMNTRSTQDTPGCHDKGDLWILLGTSRAASSRLSDKTPWVPVYMRFLKHSHATE